MPKIFMSSINDLPIKGAVGKLTATKGRKDEANRGRNPWYLTFFYVMTKWFYHTFYFYFFPFTIIYLPLLVLLFDKE